MEGTTHATADDLYDAADTERWAAEPDKRPGRTAFQRDRARVLHSAALRRLAGKTQVVTPGTRSYDWDASPRTRLTHSLECAQVGRELGAALGCDPDLVEAACLSHDMGHPPFGHNGEEALNEFAKDCGGFEGNAQSLRLLTRLEPKRFVPDPAGGELVSVGLNLTRACLDAATKYPWARGGHPTDPGSVKFGAYEDDLPVFAWLRRGAPADRKCFEAQVMDWADDVAYSVHDFEDGLHAGHLDPNLLFSEPERTAIWRVAIGRYVPADTEPEELRDALDRLMEQEWWPHGYDGSAVAQARLKDATSQLIGRFCLAAEGATREAYGSGRLTRYGAELVVPARRATSARSSRRSPICTSCSATSRSGSGPISASSWPNSQKRSAPAPPRAWTRSSGPSLTRRRTTRPESGRSSTRSRASRTRPHAPCTHASPGVPDAPKGELIGPLPLHAAGSVRDARMWSHVAERL